MPPIPVTTYYLEMQDPRELRPKPAPHSELELVRILPPSPELNRFFYTTVGADWYWTDRLPWTYQQWQAYLNRSEVETWILTDHGLPAGYFELVQQFSGENAIDVEVAYFGLLPQFVGHGLGGYLLTCAIARAWQIEASRVWLHTCTLDHPQAFANYQARGMRLYKQRTELEEVAPRSSGPWPGAFPA